MPKTKARIIYRPKEMGLVAHAGLELEHPDGRVSIFHNSPDKGPGFLSSFEEFSQGKPVVVASEFEVDSISVRNNILSIIKSGRKYHPVFFNCEHAVNFAINNFQRGSVQLINAAIGAALGAFFYVVFFQGEFCVIDFVLISSFFSLILLFLESSHLLNFYPLVDR